MNKKNSNRSFGLVFFVVLLLIAFWSFRGEYHQIKLLPLSFSIIFLILGLLNSKLLNPLNMLWFKFGLFLGATISPIVMGIIFFLVITPIGFLMKIIGKDLLNIKYDNKKKSYWINRSKTKSTMKQQF